MLNVAVPPGECRALCTSCLWLSVNGTADNSLLTSVCVLIRTKKMNSRIPLLILFEILDMLCDE
jgi:hypothetical protein